MFGGQQRYDAGCQAARLPGCQAARKELIPVEPGYGPDRYKFAGGKPLNLIDGSGLLALCHQYEIPARILDHGKGIPAAKKP